MGNDSHSNVWKNAITATIKIAANQIIVIQIEIKKRLMTRIRKGLWTTSIKDLRKELGSPTADLKIKLKEIDL